MQTIRHSLNNDSLFRSILVGLNKTFYHQTVTTAQIENYISGQSGFDYSKVFDQYLRTVDIPKLEFYFRNDKHTIFYRYTGCIAGFNLPLVLQDGSSQLRIVPSNKWQSIAITDAGQKLFKEDAIGNWYYITATEVPAIAQQ